MTTTFTPSSASNAEDSINAFLTSHGVSSHNNTDETDNTSNSEGLSTDEKKKIQRAQLRAKLRRKIKEKRQPTPNRKDIASALKQQEAALTSLQEMFKTMGHSMGNLTPKEIQQQILKNPTDFMNVATSMKDMDRVMSAMNQAITNPGVVADRAEEHQGEDVSNITYDDEEAQRLVELQSIVDGKDE